MTQYARYITIIATAALLCVLPAAVLRRTTAVLAWTMKHFATDADWSHTADSRRTSRSDWAVEWPGG